MTFKSVHIFFMGICVSFEFQKHCVIETMLKMFITQNEGPCPSPKCQFLLCFCYWLYDLTVSFHKVGEISISNMNLSPCIPSQQKQSNHENDQSCFCFYMCIAGYYTVNNMMISTNQQYYPRGDALIFHSRIWYCQLYVKGLQEKFWRKKTTLEPRRLRLHSKCGIWGPIKLLVLKWWPAWSQCKCEWW